MSNFSQLQIRLYRTNLLALDFSPNDPIGSRQNWKNTRPFEYKYPAHSHNIHLLATTNYPTSPRRNTPTHSFHQKIQKISSLFLHQQARKSSAPEIIQRLFRLQNCLSRKSSAPENIQRLSNHQQQPTTAISSSNQQQRSTAAISSSNQQQQSATAISNSNQQQQSAAATSSSGQQQQSTAATCISNQHLTLPAAPTQSTPTSVSYHYSS